MASSGLAKPELAVNQHGATVADALNGFIAHAADGLARGARLDIATAYFNVGGYSLLADSLDKLAGVRLLIGAEPGPPERRTRALGSEPVNARRAELRRVGDLLDAHTDAPPAHLSADAVGALSGRPGRRGRRYGGQAEAVLRVIEEQGLQPQPVPEPLPEITADDVHLVCWQSLTA